MSHVADLKVHRTTSISGMNIIIEDIKAQREGLLGIVYMILNKLAEIFCGISIGSTARIGRRLSIEHHGCIVIHGSSVIGDDCLIRHGVTLGNSGYNDPLGAPTVGSRVQIGAGAKLLGRITVGNDVIIGANAVVVRDVPDNSVVGGVPARPLVTRSIR
jgi:serine O-acetyltransferase